MKVTDSKNTQENMNADNIFEDLYSKIAKKTLNNIEVNTEFMRNNRTKRVNNKNKYLRTLNDQLKEYFL